MSEHTEADDTLPDEAYFDTLVDLEAPFADDESQPKRLVPRLIRPRARREDDE